LPGRGESCFGEVAACPFRFVRSAVVMNTRSPQTMGDALPLPRMAVFHLMFFVSLQIVGGLAVAETPSFVGPRQLGHWAAPSILSSALTVVKVAAQSKIALTHRPTCFKKTCEKI